MIDIAWLHVAGIVFFAFAIYGFCSLVDDLQKLFRDDKEDSFRVVFDHLGTPHELVEQS